MGEKLNMNQQFVHYLQFWKKKGEFGVEIYLILKETPLRPEKKRITEIARDF